MSLLQLKGPFSSIKFHSDKKMKLFVLIPAFATADWGLNNAISNAQESCSKYMERAFNCLPPKRQIARYNFRLEKVRNIKISQKKNFLKCHRSWLNLFRFFPMQSITRKLASVRVMALMIKVVTWSWKLQHSKLSLMTSSRIQKTVFLFTKKLYFSVFLELNWSYLIFRC